MGTSAIVAEVERHGSEMKRLVSAFRSAIEGLPDNPRIQRVSSHGFIGTFSDMGPNWSVEHHDFKRQYEILSEMVEKSPSRAVQIIRDSVERGSIRPDGKYSLKLHQDVVEHLRGLLGDDNV